jgi:hypothetical protein
MSYRCPSTSSRIRPTSACIRSMAWSSWSRSLRPPWTYRSIQRRMVASGVRSSWLASATKLRSRSWARRWASNAFLTLVATAASGPKSSATITYRVRSAPIRSVPFALTSTVRGDRAVTNFEVQPAALRELAEMLGRVRDDIERASRYLAKVENFEGGTGYIGWCLDGHKAAYRTLSDWLGKLADPTMSGTVTAVEASAALLRKDRCHLRSEPGRHLSGNRSHRIQGTHRTHRRRVRRLGAVR